MTDQPMPEAPQPKPRGWRGYIKEYVVIVVGVLTALAAQQGADWLRWRHEVSQAREGLRAEMAANNLTYFARRIALADCAERQLGETAAIIADLEAGRAPGKFTVFRTGSGSLISDSEWQSQRASQVLTHFPRAELAAMTRYYALILDFRPWTQREGDAWQELGVLRDPPRGITTSDLIRLRVNLANAQRSHRLIVLNSRRMLNISADLGLVTGKVAPQIVRDFCTMAEDEYQRRGRSQDLR